MASKTKKVSTQKLTTIKKVSCFVSSLETSIDLENFYPLLVNKTESQIVEFVENFQASIGLQVSKQLEASKASRSSTCNHSLNFETLIRLLANSDRSMIEFSRDKRSLMIDITNKSFIAIISKTEFKDSWFVAKKGRYYATTKFNSLTDMVGFRSLRNGLLVSCGKLDRFNKKRIMLRIEILDVTERNQILKNIELNGSQSTFSSVHKNNTWKKESEFEFQEFETIVELLDSKLDK